MSPATWPRDDPEQERLLLIDPGRGAFSDAHVSDLASLFSAGDVLVVNDAATLPGSLQGRDAQGSAVEVRLIADRGEARFSALLFGEGDWRTKTEQRPAPPPLSEGAEITFGEGLSAKVVSVSQASARMVDVRFSSAGAALWAALYRLGRPIQYAYVRAPLALYHVTTAYASRPWAAEMPSAGRPLTWRTLLALARKGVSIVSLSHAAGISSTGDSALDALLPLPERYEIPEETARVINEAKARGRRIIAVGTTVARALEGSARESHGRVAAGLGETDLVIGPGLTPRVVDGLLTGVHEPHESHFKLLGAFAPEALLRAAHEHAEESGYLCHEFGDSSLILRAQPLMAG